jgi:hypothetical protein
MRKKRNAVKQIMSEVHREARAGTLKLSGHDGFLGEVRRRIHEAGLPEEELEQLADRPAKRQDGAGHSQP